MMTMPLLEWLWSQGFNPSERELIIASYAWNKGFKDGQEAKERLDSQATVK